MIDPNNSLTNKHKYLVASQDEDVRKYCRGVKGVPLIFIKKSIMVMEKMADNSLNVREATERGKFRNGLRGRNTGLLKKRKREEGEHYKVREGSNEDKSVAEEDERIAKKKKTRGPRGPNPLSVKKSKKAPRVPLSREKLSLKLEEATRSVGGKISNQELSALNVNIVEAVSGDTPTSSAKRKRKRNHKSKQLGDLAAVINGGDKASE